MVVGSRNQSAIRRIVAASDSHAVEARRQSLLYQQERNTLALAELRNQYYERWLDSFRLFSLEKVYAHVASDAVPVVLRTRQTLFVQEGCLVGHEQFNGAAVDVVIGSLTRSRWKKRSSPMSGETTSEMRRRSIFTLCLLVPLVGTACGLRPQEPTPQVMDGIDERSNGTVLWPAEMPPNVWLLTGGSGVVGEGPWSITYHYRTDTTQGEVYACPTPDRCSPATGSEVIRQEEGVVVYAADPRKLSQEDLDDFDDRDASVEAFEENRAFWERVELVDDVPDWITPELEGGR